MSNSIYQKIYITNLYTDLSLVINNKTYNLHKHFLIQKSDYFKKMLLIENFNNNIIEPLYLKNYDDKLISDDIINLIIKYLYDEPFDIDLNFRILMDLYQICDYLLLDELKKKVFDKIKLYMDKLKLLDSVLLINKEQLNFINDITLIKKESSDYLWKYKTENYLDVDYNVNLWKILNPFYNDIIHIESFKFPLNINYYHKLISIKKDFNKLIKNYTSNTPNREIIAIINELNEDMKNNFNYYYYYLNTKNNINVIRYTIENYNLISINEYNILKFTEYFKDYNDILFKIIYSYDINSHCNFIQELTDEQNEILNIKRIIKNKNFDINI